MRGVAVSVLLFANVAVAQAPGAAGTPTGDAPAAVPVAEPLSSGAAMLEVDAEALALAGGEDYELLATLPANAVERAREELRSGFGLDLSEIGEIVAGPGIEAVDADGGTAPLEPAGWDHFAHG